MRGPGTRDARSLALLYSLARARASMKWWRVLRLPVAPGLKTEHSHFSLVREHARWRPNVSQNCFENLRVCQVILRDLGRGAICQIKLRDIICQIKSRDIVCQIKLRDMICQIKS